MSYIFPNSRIDFYEDLGLSQDYNDSLYFPTTKAKDDYFSAILQTGHSVQKCYYVRENRGFVRVELPMSLMIKIQYMRFKNTSYENKWWYAFVKDVNYINDNTTEVEFELDPLMGWMGEFRLAECFVERQHSTTDVVGDNVVQENLDIGQYTYGYRQDSGLFAPEQGYTDAWVYVMWFAPNQQISPINASGLYDNIYSGCTYFISTTAEGMTNKILELTTANLADSIVAIRMMPAKIIPNYYSDNLYHAKTPRTKSIARQISGAFGNYTPKNKKLYTYPYNLMTVVNCEGDSVELRYEYFGTIPPNTATSNTEFSLYTYGGVSPKVMCVPKNYRGQVECYPEQITMQSFPMCSWNVDTYKAYVAQMETSLPSQMLSAGLSGVLNGMVGGMTSASNYNINAKNPISAVGTGLASGVSAGAMGAIQPISNLLATYAFPPTMPNAVKGQSVSDVYSAYRVKDFYFYRTRIDEEHARIIDNYFTMFGYADRTVHTPNMNARERFTYVKTQGCKIHCNCPASDADFIESLFNNGIRFWKRHDWIGDYDTDNPVLSTP